MAKLSSINKNERRKKLVKKYAGQYAKLKAIANDKSHGRDRAPDRAPQDGRDSAQRRTRPASATAASSPAVRAAYYRKFRPVRISCANLGNKGLIPGLTKSSW